MEKKEVSWVVVIIGLFLFFPVGLYFLAKKSETSIAAGTLIQICGWFNAFMAFIMFTAMIGEYATGGEGWGVLFFGAFAVVFIYIGFKNKKRLRRSEKYINYIKNHRLYSIDKIAELENTSFDAVVKDLKFIFSYSFLSEVAYLDAPNRVVVPKNMQESRPVNNVLNAVNNTVSNITTTTTTTGNSTTTTSRTVLGNTPNNVENINRTTVVRCSGCGASSTVTVGSTTECEYCGAPINA